MTALNSLKNSNDVTLAPAGGYQCHVTLCEGDKREIAKFCLSDTGVVYPIPFQPKSVNDNKELLWSKNFTMIPKLPTMFYAFAHIGEQTSNSLRHAVLSPIPYKCYQHHNAAEMWLEVVADSPANDKNKS